MSIYKKLEAIAGVREDLADIVLDSIDVFSEIEELLPRLPPSERKKILVLLKKQSAILKRLDFGPWTQ